MSPKVVAARKRGLLTFLNSMVCLLEAGVSDTIEGMFWDFVEHRLERDAKASCPYKIVQKVISTNMCCFKSKTIFVPLFIPR